MKKPSTHAWIPGGRQARLHLGGAISDFSASGTIKWGCGGRLSCLMTPVSLISILMTDPRRCMIDTKKRVNHSIQLQSWTNYSWQEPSCQCSTYPFCVASVVYITKKLDTPVSSPKMSSKKGDGANCLVNPRLCDFSVIFAWHHLDKSDEQATWKWRMGAGFEKILHTTFMDRAIDRQTDRNQGGKTFKHPLKLSLAFVGH